MTNKKSQESILVIEDNEDINLLKKVESNLKEKKESIPSQYIEIKLDSLGKLSAPTILHFRNYNMSEVLKLTTARSIDQYETIIECLNEMCWEHTTDNFDCGSLVEQEVKEILLTIYGTWINSKIMGLEYYVDLNPKDIDIDDSSNIKKMDFPVKDLKTNPLPEKFLEPINVEIDSTIVKFRLARFNDFIFTNSYLKEKYFKEERRFSDMESNLKEDEEIDYTEYKAYKKYLKKREEDFYNILIMQIVTQYNDIVLDTIEKKTEYYKIISFDFWKTMQDWLKDFTFGIDPNLTFKPLLDNGQEGTEITRMFRLPLELFLPNNKSERLGRAKISFG